MDSTELIQKFLQDRLGTAPESIVPGARLADLGLLVERSIDCQINGERLTLNGFKVVDEDKLRALKPEVIQELFQSGALGFIHAHLLSLNNVNKLGARMSRKLAN